MEHEVEGGSEMLRCGRGEMRHREMRHADKSNGKGFSAFCTDIVLRFPCDPLAIESIRGFVPRVIDFRKI